MFGREDLGGARARARGEDRARVGGRGVRGDRRPEREVREELEAVGLDDERAAAVVDAVAPDVLVAKEDGRRARDDVAVEDDAERPRDARLVPTVGRR